MVATRQTLSFLTLPSSILSRRHCARLRWSAVAVCSSCSSSGALIRVRRPSPPFMKKLLGKRHRTFVSTSTPSKSHDDSCDSNKDTGDGGRRFDKQCLQQRRSRFRRRADDLTNDDGYAAASRGSTRVSGLWSTILRRHTLPFEMTSFCCRDRRGRVHNARAFSSRS